ncbi:MAG: response regulator transcription factor [Saprospiraceae bacterium]|jgi:two-component system LytT family response regulator|nr:response regulator transcription factor [Saprospiraceae bacterium]
MSNSLISAILIDDEEHCLKTLSWNLNEFCPEIKILGTANNGKEGLNLINQLNPDLVFLDIEMPVMNGLEMLAKFDKINFKVIFTTAYNEYAIKAIKLNAIDYLLKPIDKDDLRTAISKLSAINSELTSRKIQNLKYNMSVSTDLQRITVGTFEGVQFFDLKEITFLEADSNYTMLHFFDGTKILSSRTLKEYEEILPQESFFRCHHSFIVNFRYIKKYIKGEGGEIELSNGLKIAVSRRKKQEFIDWISM